MTQLEELMSLLAWFGIDVKATPKKYWGEDVTAVALVAKETPHVVGYTDFFCEFVFTPEGDFKEAGVWE